MSPSALARTTLAAGLLLVATSTARAQWATESLLLDPGWSAVWLSLDTSHADIDTLLANSPDIEEIWRWNPVSSTAVFTQSPAQPVQGDAQWFVWKRGFPADSTMTRLTPNCAYLVKLADSAVATTLDLTGQPVPPSYAWSRSGLNFFGFPMATPANVTQQNFERFLNLTPDIPTSTDIFAYLGGPLGPTNPKAVTAPRITAVTRGRAYWLRSSTYSEFYGPLQVEIASSGLRFGDTGTLVSFRLTNTTSSPVTATLTPATSAPAPAGQPPVAGPVPLRLRGAIQSDGSFAYTDLSAPVDIELTASSSSLVVVALDRATMAGNPGDTFQSVLQVSDSLGVSRIDLPVQAVTTSRSGLWVGAALIKTVDQVTTAPAPQADGTATVAVSTAADAAAPFEFPVRLIVHRADDGSVKLLQAVFIGNNPSGTTILTTDEDNLDPTDLATARRLTSTTFPLDAVINAAGDLGLAGSTTATTVLAHNASTNPFVHTYHPDHDNRDAAFAPTDIGPGLESYTITRDITLDWLADGTSIGVSDLAWGSTTLGGHYSETFSGLRSQPVDVSGTFVLYRVTDIPSLTN